MNKNYKKNFILISLFVIIILAILYSHRNIKIVYAAAPRAVVIANRGSIHGGKVIDLPNGQMINCGSNTGTNPSCTEYGIADDQVVLQAIPSAGSNFSEWIACPNGGGECIGSQEKTCPIIMDNRPTARKACPKFSPIPRSAAESREIRVITSWKEKGTAYKSVEFRTVLKKLEELNF